MIGNIAAGLYGVGVTPSTNSYESIATVTVGAGGASNVEFTSISSGYKHLQIRALVRGTQAVTNNYFQIQFNGDTGSNYYGAHWLKGEGSSATAGADGTANVIYVERSPAGTATASIYGANIIDILDYVSTSKYKTLRNLGGFDANGSGQIELTSGLWMNTNAINSIKLFPSANNFAEYTQFALYGIKD
jgi:hypothetical protein